VVTAHGGTIRAENRNDGALFTFTLPAHVFSSPVAVNGTAREAAT